jgi:hypothetical protein
MHCIHCFNCTFCTFLCANCVPHLTITFAILNPKTIHSHKPLRMRVQVIYWKTNLVISRSFRLRRSTGYLCETAPFRVFITVDCRNWRIKMMRVNFSLFYCNSPSPSFVDLVNNDIPLSSVTSIV